MSDNHDANAGGAFPRVDRSRLLALGKLGAPHGMRGEFHFIPFCDVNSSLLELIDPARATRADDAELEDDEESASDAPLPTVLLGFRDKPREPLLEARIEGLRGGPSKLLIALEEVVTREEAEAFPRYEILLPEEMLRGALEEDAFLAEDLKGCAAFAPDGSELGVVVDIEFGAAHEMLVVRSNELDEKGAKRSFRVPFVKALVPAVDMKGRRVTLDLPEGLAEL